MNMFVSYIDNIYNDNLNRKYFNYYNLLVKSNKHVKLLV